MIMNKMFQETVFPDHFSKISVYLSVCVHFMSFFPWRGDRTWALCSAWKSTKLILQTGFFPYQLTLWKKSALTQTPSGQIAKVFIPHEIAEKTNDYSGINILM